MKHAVLLSTMSLEICGALRVLPIKDDRPLRLKAVRQRPDAFLQPALFDFNATIVSRNVEKPL